MFIYQLTVRRQIFVILSIRNHEEQKTLVLLSLVQTRHYIHRATLNARMSHLSIKSPLYVQHNLDKYECLLSYFVFKIPCNILKLSLEQHRTQLIEGMTEKRKDNIPSGSLMLPWRPCFVDSSTGLNHTISSAKKKLFQKLIFL